VKRWRKQLRDDLWKMLWNYRFGGGISTKTAADVIAEYVEANYKPMKHGSARGKAVEKDPAASA